MSGKAKQPAPVSSSLLVKAFCNLLEEFLSDVSQTFPEHGNFAFFLSSIQMMRLVGKDQFLLESFMTYLTPYATQIKARDESFFLDHSFDSEISEGGGGGEEAGFIRNEILKIKSIWVESDARTRDIIYDYILKLVTIGERAVASIAAA